MIKNLLKITIRNFKKQLGFSMLNILGCLDRPTDGSYFLGGTDVSVMPDDELSLARGKNPAARTIALWSLSFELLGVVVVGTASMIAPEVFPDQTVWSQFGAGYLFIPVALPIVGLWWLRRGVHS